MDIATINSDLIRGNVTTIILKALYDGTSYGYDILKLIEEKTNGKYVIKQPTLYSCLKRLEKQGLIESYMGTDDDTSGARRRYYTLTKLGQDYLSQQQSEYEYSRTILDRLLSDKVFDLASDNTPFEINDLRPYTKVSLDGESQDNVKVVEKVVEKPIYVDRPVEKVVYVDRPVEKVVYVDRPVEKLVYVDRPTEDAAQHDEQPAVRQHSGIIINNQTRMQQPQYTPQPASYQPAAQQQYAPATPVAPAPQPTQYTPNTYVTQEQYMAAAQEQYTPQPEAVQEPVYTAPSAPAYVEAQSKTNTHSGIIINNANRNRMANVDDVNTQAQRPNIPQAPLINRMQEKQRGNDPQSQNVESIYGMQNNYKAPEQPNANETAQERAARILGLGKYRTDHVIDPNAAGDDDSPSGPQW